MPSVGIRGPGGPPENIIFWPPPLQIQARPPDLSGLGGLTAPAAPPALSGLRGLTALAGLRGLGRLRLLWRVACLGLMSRPV